MFRWPAERPPRRSIIRRGSSSELSFHTTDGARMEIEAHQKLDPPVDVKCWPRSACHPEYRPVSGNCLARVDSDRYNGAHKSGPELGNGGGRPAVTVAPGLELSNPSHCGPAEIRRDQSGVP